jgi:hypothetical protein
MCPIWRAATPGSGNLIVQGDNLVALKALLPYYAGQVKCIYIDPPYNTGNERDQSGMNVMIEAQEIARRFNEAEGVWRCYEQKRELRRLLGSRTPLPADILDDLDWQEAERECRETQAIGFFQLRKS